mgnify:CR=1 FL=1
MANKRLRDHQLLGGFLLHQSRRRVIMKPVFVLICCRGFACLLAFRIRQAVNEIHTGLTHLGPRMRRWTASRVVPSCYDPT